MRPSPFSPASAAALRSGSSTGLLGPLPNASAPERVTIRLNSSSKVRPVEVLVVPGTASLSPVVISRVELVVDNWNGLVERSYALDDWISKFAMLDVCSWLIVIACIH